MALLEIAALARSGASDSKVSALIEEHSRKFAWLPNYSFHLEPHSKAHFQRQLSLLLEEFPQPEQELARIDGEFESRKNSFTQLQESLPSESEIAFLFDAAEKVLELREHGDALRRKFYHRQRLLLQEASRRSGYSLNDLRLMLPSEICFALAGNNGPSKSELQEREKGFLYLMKNGECKLYSGESALVLGEKLLGREDVEESEVKGTVACAGFARGSVVVIKHLSDLTKVRQGNILVAVKTGPDYVPAMRKAAGIVTNEGGLTSHAAIISREFGIPCVVGTKKATTVFKTGDEIEVNANDGIVRKKSG